MNPRTNIHWHSIEDVAKEIKDKDFYWKAIITVMAYAGLSAHEVRGLHNEDYDGQYLIVQPYEERGTKSINRHKKGKCSQEVSKTVFR